MPVPVAVAEPDAPSRDRVGVVAWLTTAAVLGYLCRNCIGVAEKTINEDLGLSLGQSGWFMGAFFWSYALLQVPAGLVGRRWGTRRVLSLSAVGWSLAVALLASASLAESTTAAFAVLVTAQLLMGAAQAAIFPCAVQSLRTWIPERTRAFATSFLAAGMQVGAVIAASLTGFLLTTWHWEGIFAAYALPGLLWAVMFSLSFRNRPDERAKTSLAEWPPMEDEAVPPADSTNPDDGPTKATANETPDENASAGWDLILACPSVWFLCAQQVFRASGYAFFATWFPSFLQETRGVSTAESGYLQSFVFAASLCGGLTGGRVLDWVYTHTGNLRLSRTGVGVTATLACSGLILTAFFVYRPVAATALIAAGAFVAAFAGPCAYVSSIDIGGRSVPQVFGMMNMSGNLAAAATPVLIAAFFERVGDWNLILCLFAGIYFMAALCWWLTDPRRSVEPRHDPP